MSKLSLSAKIIACVTLLLIVTIIIAVVSSVSMNSSANKLEALRTFNVPLNSHATVAAASISNMIVYANMYSSYGRAADYDKGKTYFITTMTELNLLKELIMDSGEVDTDQLAFINEVLSDMDKFLKSMELTQRNLQTMTATFAAFQNNIAKANNIIDELIKEGTSMRVLNDADDRTIASKILYPLLVIRNVNVKTEVMFENAYLVRDMSYLTGRDKLLQDRVEMLKVVLDNAGADIIESVRMISNVIDAAASDAEELINFVKSLEEENSSRSVIAANLVEGLSAMMNDSFNTLNNSMDDLQENLSRATLLAIVLAIIGFAFGISAIIFINVTVIRKLRAFVKVVAGFATGEGDLTIRVPVTSRDELGQLSGYINQFVSNIQQIISQVKNSADNVASGNTELAATMEELSTTFNSQSEQITNVANNMNVMSNVSENIVQSLNTSIDVMNESDDALQKGNVQLQSVMKTMNNIKDQTTSLSGTITSLTESSKHIEAILEVISGIADQTNLLALNAAIEAARAGEAGRGFAVVADEVRKLAEGTQKSTSEIASIISTLQSDTEKASHEMVATVNRVNEGMDGVTNTGALMTQIVRSVHTVTESMSSVNNDVSNQFTMINEISDNTQNLASGVEESVLAINEVSSTVAHLQNQAEELANVVDKFVI